MQCQRCGCSRSRNCTLISFTKRGHRKSDLFLLSTSPDFAGSLPPAPVLHAPRSFCSREDLSDLDCESPTRGEIVAAFFFLRYLERREYSSLTLLLPYLLTLLLLPSLLCSDHALLPLFARAWPSGYLISRCCSCRPPVSLASNDAAHEQRCLQLAWLDGCRQFAAEIRQSGALIRLGRSGSKLQAAGGRRQAEAEESTAA